jgi:hypothetical protein
MPHAWCWWWCANWKPKWKFQNRCVHEGGVGIDAAPEHAGSSVACAEKAVSDPTVPVPRQSVGHGKLLNKGQNITADADLIKKLDSLLVGSTALKDHSMVVATVLAL